MTYLGYGRPKIKGAQECALLHLGERGERGERGEKGERGGGEGGEGELIFSWSDSESLSYIGA